jgi:phosphogluconate dehydratase
MNPVIEQVTARIRQRSATLRNDYVERMQALANIGRSRGTLACGNMAHVVAACAHSQKNTIQDLTRVNIAIITAYNDMLSAHQPYQFYPDEIKQVVQKLGHSAQVAGGVPAMCDGVTQGQPGMDLSLFSRDVIAQSTAISLSHNAFDATLLLGICDKIAPGELMGALSFGYLPTAFVPAGPMTSGISNDEKVRIRQKYAAGELDRQALQEMENQAYHSHGTCTFYGTANTNQLVFEAMGLMLPGSAFVDPDCDLRHALTAHTAELITSLVHGSSQYRPLYAMLDEKSLVNGLVALLASGGSTNHTMHMIAVARAAGLILTWDDFRDLSDTVPLLAKIYPNGPADINAFHQAGGVPLLMNLLAQRGLLHMDATPLTGSMEDYLQTPSYTDQKLAWHPTPATRNADVVAPSNQFFSPTGGLKVLDGNLGRAVIKVSAVAEQYLTIEAPAIVFDSQHDVEKAYHANQLNQDAIIVVRFNGPAANGMPELHKLMPILGNLQKAGYQVALLTDGRLSGASGKIPSVLHVTPEAAKGGPLAQLQTGDLIRLDARHGTLQVLTDISARPHARFRLTDQHAGLGRELFGGFRTLVSSAEMGASILFSSNVEDA